MLSLHSSQRRHQTGSIIEALRCAETRAGCRAQGLQPSTSSTTRMVPCVLGTSSYLIPSIVHLLEGFWDGIELEILDACAIRHSQLLMALFSEKDTETEECSILCRLFNWGPCPQLCLLEKVFSKKVFSNEGAGHKLEGNLQRLPLLSPCVHSSLS